MSQCWQFVPEERPTFTELVTWTENMLKNSGDYLDLSPNLVNNVTYLQPLFLPGLCNSKFQISEPISSTTRLALIKHNFKIVK